MRPIIAISGGDPLGIGPEIIVKALADRELRSRARFHLYVSTAALAHAAESAAIRPFWWRLSSGADAPTVRSALHHDVLVFDEPVAEALAEQAAGPSSGGGAASFRWVERCIDAALAPAIDPRHADAIVTAPIAKTSWHLAGHRQFPGHTELLAARCHARRHGMLFVGPSLRVMLVTIHIPLAAVADQLTAMRIFDAIDLANRACLEMGVPAPRIGVCGVNPHAGEGGIMGDEDDRLIRPAIDNAVKSGIDAKGPFPGDSIFLDAAAPPRGKGKFDCVIAMYHDQGLIPMKLLDRERTVNMTVGLPVIRTSPAHGTAFDIAGRNLADPGSMKAAIELALTMVGAKARARSSV